MRAIHITHTAPFFAREINKQKEFSICDSDQLSTILSALKWRENNGDICLYTDTVGYNFYKNNNMLQIWDGGINIEALNNIDLNIDFEIFWASGKLIALSNEKSPCVVIDTDFIAWINISPLIKNENDTICIHKEEILENVYLPSHLLKVPNNYCFNKKFDWTEKPCNTAFIYFGNDKLKNYYIKEAFKFMNNNKEKPDEFVSQMVFAEQRLLPMCGKILNLEVKSFMTINELFSEQEKFTHIWGHKEILRKNEEESERFCVGIAKRIFNDYKNKYKFIFKIPVIDKYVGSL